MCSRPKKKRPVQTVIISQSQSLGWCGVEFVPMAMGTCTFVTETLMQESGLRCLKDHTFSSDIQNIFNKTMQNHTLYQRGAFRNEEWGKRLKPLTARVLRAEMDFKCCDKDLQNYTQPGHCRPPCRNGYT